MAALRKWLLTGLLVIVPGVITAWVLNWIVSTLDQTLQILPVAWHRGGAFDLFQRQAGVRHAFFRKRQCLSQGRAGAVAARGRLDRGLRHWRAQWRGGGIPAR